MVYINATGWLSNLAAYITKTNLLRTRRGADTGLDFTAAYQMPTYVGIKTGAITDRAIVTV